MTSEQKLKGMKQRDRNRSAGQTLGRPVTSRKYPRTCRARVNRAAVFGEKKATGETNGTSLGEFTVPQLFVCLIVDEQQHKTIGISRRCCLAAKICGEPNKPPLAAV